ncbi:MAG: hypothetical protein NT069_27525, partial [Planctomycetota bacterium]|nr:hypothetical protein [Planctomycetota bacterium]
GFAGLRALVAARSADDDAHRNLPRLARRRAPLSGAGRWSLWRNRGSVENSSQSSGGTNVNSTTSERQVVSKSPLDRTATEIVENWAWQLLRRWGVVFRDLLEREPGAPRWFELLQVLRRLEARGEIRGGRFITGVAGEQFALGDTVRLLRQLRDDGPKQELVILSAADPLNLVGILTKHDRVTSNASNKLAYLDGHPIAALVAGEVRWLTDPSPQLRSLLRDGRVFHTGEMVDDCPADTATGSPTQTLPSTQSATVPNKGESASPERDTAVANPPSQDKLSRGVQKLQDRLARKKKKPRPASPPNQIPRPRW